MSTTQPPPPKKANRVGLEVSSYRGAKTTLCAGCGHNAISERLIECFFEMGIEPWRVAKFSGIGCSSKSPAYFLGLSHGFNGVHGRAPAVATGAMLANSTLLGIVVTGDGDTASIGIGQYIHMLRRNVPLIYVIENNGVYGLTKGQFSATSDARREIEKRRDQRAAAGGLLRRGDPDRRDVRGALLLRRQAAAAGDPEGRHRASGAERDRCHLALRDLQRPRGFDQELQLHEGPRRAVARTRFRAFLRRHRGRDSRKARCRTSRCTTAPTCACTSWRWTMTPPTG